MDWSILRIPPLPDHARERLQAFARFVWRRFVEDQCFGTAAVLAYGTVFALVPLSVAVFGVVAAFPSFEGWNATLSHFLFTHFVPGAAQTVENYLLQAAASASQMTGVGVLGVLASALFMMKSVEDTFNRIWRVGQTRSHASRFLVYWTALTLGPLLVAASLTLSSWVLELPWVVDSELSSASETLLRLAPFLVELAAFTLLYAVVPNQAVSFRHALIGGGLASVLFEATKALFGLYVRAVPSYQQIYGALAVLPIFLLWIYLSWAVVLLGASIAASLSAFRFQPASERLPAAADWIAALRLLARFVEAQRAGAALTVGALRQCEPSIEDDTLMRLLADLAAQGFLHRDGDSGWVLLRDPQQTSLDDVYVALRAHLPRRMPEGPGVEDAIGRRAVALAAAAADPLGPALQVPLAALSPAFHKE